MDSQTGNGPNGEKTNITESYRGQEDVKSHDHPCSEDIQHLEGREI